MDTTHDQISIPWQLLRGVLADVGNNQLREAVLDLFVQTHSRIAAGELEVCVFATQRVSNLYFTLTEYGLPDFDCLIVTHDDPGSQLPYSEWRDKRVVVLDDTVFLGTSLAYTVRDIRSLVGENGSVEVRAACVDRDDASPELLRYLGIAAPATFSHQEAAQLSGDLSAVVYQALVPAMGDFFSTERLILDAEVLDLELSVNGWRAFDVTSPSSSRATTFSFSYLPSDDVRDAICQSMERIISNVSDYVSLIKVRAFGRLMGRESAVRLVPILIVEPIEARATADILERIETFMGAWPHKVATQRWGNQLQHRVLQVLLSGMVALEFDRARNPDDEYSADSLVERLDVRLLETNFGTGPSEFITHALAALMKFQNVLKGMSTYPAITKLPPYASGVITGTSALEVIMVRDNLKVNSMAWAEWSTVEDASPLVVHVGSDFVFSISRLLTSIYGRKEVPERLRIRMMKVDEYFEQYPDRSYRTVGSGITLHELSQAISAFVPDPVRAREVASLALDIFFDTGVLVSLTAVDHERKDVYRAYVFGENADLILDPIDFTYFPTTEVS